ncbi:hypothetical protein [Cellulomonas taurus]|uniref:hypothetical protein n=1 Tax=Cellulomonas taurus TaxID=2729175 RepID=UPI00145E8EFE|nr:hypothetical protein [Cellulomonas taurus]
MNNPMGKQADRSEEIAFLILEDVLGIRIFLADSNQVDGNVDGRWTHDGRSGVVEITGPPAEEQMRAFATAERKGEQSLETGSVERHHNRLAEYLSLQLAEPWAAANVAKLNAVDADERHLFLVARTVYDHEYYARLSDTYENGPVERINALALPEGISDVWFEGRAARGFTKLDPMTVRVARYNRLAGWSTRDVTLEEQQLPAPKIVADTAAAGWRRPRNRS